MLEHEAHMFGFLEKAFPLSDIGSPQQIQIRGLIFPVADILHEGGKNSRKIAPEKSRG